MAQGFEMSHALRAVRNGLPVDDLSVPEADLRPVALLKEAFQDLRLHFAHHPHVNRTADFIQLRRDLRNLLRQFPQPSKHDQPVFRRRIDKVIGQDRLNRRNGVVCTGTVNLPAEGCGQSRHSRNLACGRLLRLREAVSGVKPDLVDLLGRP